jgi:transcriptional antiterminator
MTDDWLTLTEAAAKLGISERTLQRRIADGAFQTKAEHGRKYVLLTDDSDDTTTDSQINMSDKDLIIEMQRQQIEHLKQLLDDTLQDVRESKERADTIILTLTRRLDEQVKMLEDMRQRQNIWQRVKARIGWGTVGE